MQIDKNIFEICLRNKDVPNQLRRTWAEIAQEYGFESGESLRSQYRRYERELETPDSKNVVEPETYRETFQILGDGSQTSDKLIGVCEKDLKSPEYLLKAHGFDSNLWEITHATNNKWHGPVKGGNKQTLYQSKITVKPKQQFFTEEYLDKLFDRFTKKEFSIPRLNLKKEYVKDGELLVVPIADFHLGLFSSKDVTGDDYTIEIAQKRFYDTISKVMDRVVGRKISRVLFIVGNDFLNSDNISASTTKGTPQDSYPFWYTLIDKALEIIVSSVNSLLDIAPVDIINVTSNHDNHSMYGVIKAVQAYYKDTATVTVDVSPLPRKYYNFGKSVIGLSHDIPKNKALMLMSTEGQRYWGSCKKFYWLLAHLHTAMQYEKQGLVETYRLPTFSGVSRWGNDNGYLQTDKRSQCFLLDKENGITDVLNIYV